MIEKTTSILPETIPLSLRIKPRILDIELKGYPYKNKTVIKKIDDRFPKLV